MSDFIPGFGTQARQDDLGPKQVKGGVFAPADIELIKNALNYYLRLDLGNAEERQIANLLHRLNNRT